LNFTISLSTNQTDKGNDYRIDGVLNSGINSKYWILRTVILLLIWKA